MPTEPLVVVDVSLDSDGLVSCMVVENDVRPLGLRQIFSLQTVPYHFEEVDHVVLVRGLRKEEDWFGGLVPDSSEHRDIVRPFYRDCKLQRLGLVLPAFDGLLLGIKRRLVDVEDPVRKIR